MNVLRRDFLRVSTEVAGRTALGGLTGLGDNLAPCWPASTTSRIKDAKTSVRR